MNTRTAGVDRYRQALQAIYDYLVSFRDQRWAPVPAEWIAELDRDLQNDALIDHLKRSIAATGGMGSLGDLSISPASGHDIADDAEEIGRASEVLWRMTAALYQEAKRLEAQLAR